MARVNIKKLMSLTVGLTFLMLIGLQLLDHTLVDRLFQGSDLGIDNYYFSLFNELKKPQQTKHNFKSGESTLALVLERDPFVRPWGGAEEADLVALLHDVQKPADHKGTARILEGLKARGGGAILILNKIDQVLPARLLEQAAQFESSGLFDEIFMVSALSGDGVADFRRFLAGRMPPGPWHYPEDQLSDLPLRLLAAEITREKLFLQLHQELPYALTVESEDWVNFENGDIRISQVIYVQRAQHKAMCLGKGGQKIKLIRESAQRELAETLDCRVHLFLHVKVREKWLDDPDRYRDWGLNFEA